MKLILSALAALLLAGCASMPADQRLGMYRAHAGATMASFRYYGTIYSWEPLGDSAVALWTCHEAHVCLRSCQRNVRSIPARTSAAFHALVEHRATGFPS